MSTITLSDALKSARAINAEWVKWNQLDVPKVPFNGHMVKGISKELHHTIMAAVDATADATDEEGETREVAPDARRLVLILDEIGYAFLRWMQGISQGLSSARPAGSDELENAFRRLHDAMQTRKLPPPPPMAALVAQGAPHWQIAKKYGWHCEDGSPDTIKVQEEISEPGKHYKPDEWVHPSEAAIAKEVADQWAKRQPRPVLFAAGNQVAPKPQLRSIEDMIEQRAPAAQIARVHKLTEEEVNELAKDMGIDLTEPRDIKPATEAGMQQEMIAKQEARAAAGARASRNRGK